MPLCSLVAVSVSSRSENSRQRYQTTCVDSTFLRRHLCTCSNRRHSKTSSPLSELGNSPLLSAQHLYSLSHRFSPDVSCGFMPILMWQKPHLHPMTPFPFPECCCRAVFVCLPSSDLGTSHANLALGNPPSAIGPVPRQVCPFPLQSSEGDPGDIQPTHGGSRTIRRHH